MGADKRRKGEKMKIGKRLYLFMEKTLERDNNRYPFLLQINFLRYGGKIRSFMACFILSLKTPDDDLEKKDGIIWGGRYGTNYGIQFRRICILIIIETMKHPDHLDYYQGLWEYRRRRKKDLADGADLGDGGDVGDE
jgi:hypothetical protein